MVLLQTRLQEVSTEISRVSEVEPLKERCRKAEFEIMSLLRRVQDAQEGAKKVPKLEREVKFAKERIEKLELRGVQAAELHQQLEDHLEKQDPLKTKFPTKGMLATCDVTTGTCQGTTTS